MKRDPLERTIHLGIIQLLKLNARPGVVYFHPANERRCTPAEGAFLKRMGLLAGVPDLVILTPGGCCFLEIKRPGKSLSEPQQAFRESVVAMGYSHSIAYSIDGAAEILRRWNVIGRSTVPARKVAA